MTVIALNGKFVLEYVNNNIFWVNKLYQELCQNFVKIVPRKYLH